MEVVKLQKGTYIVKYKGHDISLVDIKDTLENPHGAGTLKWSLWCTTADLEEIMEGELMYYTKREALEMIAYYFDNPRNEFLI